MTAYTDIYAYIYAYMHIHLCTHMLICIKKNMLIEHIYIYLPIIHI